MKRILFILLTLYMSGLNPGQGISFWQNYTDMKDIKKIDVSDESIWCATGGGAFRLGIDDDIVIQLTKSEGLSSQVLTSAAIDNFGRVWLGTAEGIINVYDPETQKTSKILDINRTDNSNKAINDIYIEDNIAYVSIQFGLSLIDVNTLSFIETIVKFGSFPSSTSVNSVLVTDRIYAATENGLAVQKEGASNLLNPDSWQIYLKGTQIAANNIFNIVSYNNELIISTDAGLFKLNGEWERFLPDFSANIIKVSIHRDVLYILMKNALVSYDGNETKTLAENYDLNFTDFKFTREDQFYISSNKGLLSSSNLDKLFLPNNPGSNSFQNISIDNSGHVWAATGKDLFGSGFFRFDGEEWEIYNTSTLNTLLSNSFHNVYAAPDNNVFILNWGRGFVEYSDNTFTNYYTDNTDLVGIPADPSFLVIADAGYDSKNNLWLLNHFAANRKVLSVRTLNNIWHHYEFGGNISPQSVETSALEIDENDTKWFIVNSGVRGLYYFNENNTHESLTDDTWGRLSSTEYFSGQLLTSLAVDKRGELWVGTSLGVTIITNTSAPLSGRISVFGLRQQTINCIAVDPLNRKWVGTRQGVFVMSADGSFLLEQYDSKNSPLPSDDIKSIAVDERRGTVYIGTDFGMTSLTTDAVKPNENYDDIFIYPNPFVLQNNSSLKLTIDGLVQNSSIKILTVSGKLVNEFATSGGRITSWDGRDSKGNLVASGVYIIVAYDNDVNKVAATKVAVLRK